MTKLGAMAVEFDPCFSAHPRQILLHYPKPFFLNKLVIVSSNPMFLSKKDPEGKNNLLTTNKYDRSDRSISQIDQNRLTPLSNLHENMFVPSRSNMLEDLLTSFVKLLDLPMQRQNARPQGQAWKNLTSKFNAHGCVTYIQGNPTCRYVIWMFMFQGS